MRQKRRHCSSHGIAQKWNETFEIHRLKSVQLTRNLVRVSQGMKYPWPLTQQWALSEKYQTYCECAQACYASALIIPPVSERNKIPSS